MGVDIGAKPGAKRLEHCNQLIARKPFRTVEHHVLEKVGRPGLVVVLLLRPDVDEEFQFDPLAG